ncbi:hypothetical protein MUB24_03365 [Lederbergia sp. NSJ-179]|uniref:hypothetical protein n=1 Tax=Lederbergia sp. NSJ-179 TaxID=2931402 RepID=UPI001FD331F4|nr:hypothetical protein [Lederbergia sp. NSJ-179]MCJ7839966.1 hypothetical protein [Lederbergia sp. NSJ-179]
MKKITILVMSLLVIIGLAACGGETEGKEVSSVESSDKNDGKEVEKEAAEEENEDSKGEKSKVEEVGKVIADDDYIKATLVNVEHNVDDTFDEEKYVINIDLENKTGNKIIVQARDVSIDGTMVDDMVFFSEEIAGDKNANGKMEIQNYDGDLPTMDDNIEFVLLVADDESFEDLAEHNVKVDF